MSFDSLSFLIFLPLVTGIHWWLPHKYRWIALLSASYFFYMNWNPGLIFLIILISGTTYYSGLMISRTNRKKKKQFWLSVSMIITLGVLLFFKYFSFFEKNIIDLIQASGREGSSLFSDIILPIGISFYTFQSLSYVIDVYRGRICAEIHPGYYALYVSFFPQLVAGPIERPENLIPQLKKEKKWNPEDLETGAFLLLSGLFRKIVIADFLGQFVTSVYSLNEDVDGLAVIVATGLFSFQIYNDFKGYTEIARGSARLMGIRLIKNFNRPYLADSIRDFWHRWHISLSSWFSDYLYIPMGGNQKGKAREVSAILVVFLLSGLWHGAAWNFVLWGFIHGLLIIIEIPIKKKLQFNKLPSIVSTFILVNFSWIFFRSSSLKQVWYFVSRLFSPWNRSLAWKNLNMTIPDCIQIILTIVLMIVLNQKNKKENKTILYVYFIFIIALSWLIRLEQNGNDAFIYFQF